MIKNITAAQLTKAASIKEQIESLQEELAGILNQATSIRSTQTIQRKISAAGLARIKAAQKARWAKIKNQEPRTSPKANSNGQKMSSAAKVKLSAKLKAIWAARKTAQKG